MSAGNLTELAARELLWSTLLHGSDGWVHVEDRIEVEISGERTRFIVPVRHDHDFDGPVPDTASPDWPMALKEMLAAKERRRMRRILEAFAS